MDKEASYKITGKKINKTTFSIDGDIKTLTYSESPLNNKNFHPIDLDQQLAQKDNPKMKIELIENEMKKLRKAFRKYLGLQLNTKNTPELKFYMDDSHKFTEQIDKLFKDIDSEDK